VQTLDTDKSKSVARLFKVQDAPARKWIPRPIGNGSLDYEFLAKLLHAAHGSSRHGNPKDPLDCLIYVMLSRKTPIALATRVFKRLKAQYHSWAVELDKIPQIGKTCRKR
jgi:hypothetical protein